MSLPIPTTDDISNGIDASCRCSLLLQRIETLRNFVFLWQNCHRQPDDSISSYLQSMETMVNDIYSNARYVEKKLESFCDYIR